METKTVELPLTKTELNHQDNIRRRDAKRHRELAKSDLKQTRTVVIQAINKEFNDELKKLQETRAKKLKDAYAEWQKKSDALPQEGN